MKNYLDLATCLFSMKDRFLLTRFYTVNETVRALWNGSVCFWRKKGGDLLLVCGDVEENCLLICMPRPTLMKCTWGGPTITKVFGFVSRIVSGPAHYIFVGGQGLHLHAQISVTIVRGMANYETRCWGNTSYRLDILELITSKFMYYGKFSHIEITFLTKLSDTS